ncbi:MAG: Hsp70 family protein [Alphaproteobacteria bacterium GM7ARS4]|nr:Hsp70 family protein [Alphaproteobacteria bacterium GM7ARS4]
MASVERVFGKKPIAEKNVDEVVALGAAFYAAYKSDRPEDLTSAQRQALKGKIKEVANHYYGTLALRAGELGRPEPCNDILINKNDQIPCSVTKSYYTVSDGQTSVDCRVTQSVIKEEGLRNLEIIHEGSMPLPPDRPSGQEIKVTYSYDSNQIMHCSFVDVATGKEKTVDLKLGSDTGGIIVE